MKRLLLLFMTIALTGVISSVEAQDKVVLSDKELSNQYKQEIKILELEIKTVKVKLKADRENSDLKTALTAKTDQLKELKSKKNIIDKAIKSKTAAEKAAIKAENAQKKAEKAAADAQKIKDGKK
ncbi:MAG: hypothetical protein LBC19_15580 [Tannerella sp.]|nr:hypothetical protein [Tannerella sp.]